MFSASLRIFSFFLLSGLAVSVCSAASVQERCILQNKELSREGQSVSNTPYPQFRWRADYRSPLSVSEQLSDLYVGLHNLGMLPLKAVEYHPSTPLHEFVKQQSFWVGTPTEALDALLCDLNTRICSRDRRPALQRGDTILGHISGTKFSPGQWQLKALGESAACFIVPKVSLSIGEEVAKIGDLGQDPGATRAMGAIVREECRTINTPFAKSRFCYPVAGSGQPPRKRNDFWIGDIRASDGQLAWVRRFTADLTLPFERKSYYDETAENYRYKIDDPDFAKLSRELGKYLAPAETTFRNESSMEQASIAVKEPNTLPYVYQSPSQLLDWPSGKESRTIISVIDLPANTDHCDMNGDALISAEDFLTKKRVRSASITQPFRLGDNVFLPSCPRRLLKVTSDHGTHVLGMFVAKPPTAKQQSLMRLSSYGVIYFPIDEVQMKTSIGYREKLAEWIVQAGTIGSVSAFNISWSYEPEVVSDMSLALRDPIEDAIETLDDLSLFIVAAGKRGADPDTGRCSPLPACAGAKNVLSVVAVEEDAAGNPVPIAENGALATNIGARFFSVAAPGRDIVSTVGDGDYGKLTGSSQAAPFVTAIAAQIKARGNLSPKEIKRRIIATSELNETLLNVSSGGVANAIAALNTDQDLIRLADGCEFLAVATRLVKAEGSGNADLVLDNGIEDITIEFSALRRVAKLKSGRFVVFYDDESGEFSREVGLISDNTKASFIRVKNIKKQHGCNNPEMLMRIPVKDVEDFIARTK
ncbi:S8 family serine peptidase [Sinorhizobium medicae]|uniref:S8 family serine peptidase n=1 Tax=Sinorhizobium medicae TaxID=110321 RepID=UPI0013E31B59|nr:S8 family serine peptidase [Sinorhizobium medicae]